MALVTLSVPNPNKPTTSKHTHLEYKVVTQVIVTLEIGNCTPSVVADLVRQQVGFPVILLDSKCFPILENETTSAIEFWKSNRKILAASSSLYSRLTGSSADPGRAKIEILLLQVTLRALKSCISTNLHQILDGVETIRQKHEVLGKISSMFECVVHLSVLTYSLLFDDFNILNNTVICQM